MPNFTLKAQLNTAQDWYEIGQGARLEVFGQRNAGRPQMIRLNNGWAFTLSDTTQVNIQGYKVPVPLTPNPMLEAIENALRPALVTRADNERLVIAALVKMLGGAVVIQADEISDALSLDLSAENQLDFRRIMLKVNQT